MCRKEETRRGPYKHKLTKNIQNNGQIRLRFIFMSLSTKCVKETNFKRVKDGTSFVAKDEYLLLDIRNEIIGSLNNKEIEKIIKRMAKYTFTS